MEDKTKAEGAVKTSNDGPKNGCDKPSKCCENGTCTLPKDNKCPDPN
jgi:hypothetical protein